RAAACRRSGSAIAGQTASTVGQRPAGSRRGKRLGGLAFVGLTVLTKVTAHATVLLVEDVQMAGDYYRDKLGFEVTYFEKNPSHYAYANRGEMWVHFARFEHAGPAPNSVAVPPDMFDVYVYVDDVDALHEELVGR